MQRNISIGHYKKNDKFNIKDSIFDINLADNTGLAQLKDAVLYHIQVGLAIPKTWVDVRKEIEEMVQKKHYISFDTFEAVCRKINITQKEQIVDLGNYFHDWGIVL